MSEEISLNKDERRLLKEELKQKLLSYFTIVIIGGLLMMVFVILLNNSGKSRFSENQELLQKILIGISLSGFAFFLFLKVRFILSDLSLGKKRIVTAILDNKKISQHDGWHANAAADSSSNPELVEYILEVDSKEILVEKEIYEMFKPGDKVEISFGLKSRMLLGIRRVE
jgi:hypothetical protein